MKNPSVKSDSMSMLKAALSIFTVGLLLSCGDRPVSSSGTGQLALQVEWAAHPTAAKIATAHRADRMEVVVTGGSARVVRRDLERAGEKWRAELELQPGRYSVNLHAYKGDEVHWSGSATAEVLRGQTTTVPITLDRLYRLRLSQTDLDFGSINREASVQVSNAGTGQSFSWTAVEQADWMIITARQTEDDSHGDGLISGTGDDQLLLLIDRTGQPAGFYAATILITSNSGSDTLRVHMTVDPPSTPDPEPEPMLTVDLGDGVQMEFAWISPSSFFMGSPESEIDRSANEGPVHVVDLTQGFYLGIYEVTQAQWTRVMGDNPSRTSGSDHPVESISWVDAQAFIHQLNQTAGDSLYRLPSEAEWEYAARAGTDTRWSFGDREGDLSQYAWFGTKARPQPVGMRLPNPWGLHDVHGNVWEWVQDWYDPDYYASSPRVDPPGPATGTARVLRGGAYNREPRFLRSADRLWFDPSVRSPDIGVRIVRISD